MLSTTAGAVELARAIDRKGLAAETRNRAIELAVAHARLGRPRPVRAVPSRREAVRLDGVRREGLGASRHDGETPRAAAPCSSSRRPCRAGTAIASKGRGPRSVPDLTAIGRRLKKPQVLEGILDPSRRSIRSTSRGWSKPRPAMVNPGCWRKQADDEVVLKTIENKSLRIPHGRHRNHRPRCANR